MTASKRVAKELEDLQKQLPKYLRHLCSEEDNVLVWHALLLPERPPYNLKAFRLCISFPREYPFQPPTVKFTTRIYHPNVDRDGRVCLPLINKKNWKASTKTCQGAEWFPRRHSRALLTVFACSSSYLLTSSSWCRPPLLLPLGLPGGPQRAGESAGAGRARSARARGAADAGPRAV
uniref:Uncharacterized protein n=1 Tax=Ovis aries TaxID=9940 RepID=A0AC11D8D8_SHEEP